MPYGTMSVATANILVAAGFELDAILPNEFQEDQNVSIDVVWGGALDEAFAVNGDTDIVRLVNAIANSLEFQQDFGHLDPEISSRLDNESWEVVAYVDGGELYQRYRHPQEELS